MGGDPIDDGRNGTARLELREEGEEGRGKRVLYTCTHVNDCSNKGRAFILNRAHRSLIESFLDKVEVLCRTPTLCYKRLPADVQVEHIHGMEDGLKLLYLEGGREEKRKEMR